MMSDIIVKMNKAFGLKIKIERVKLGISQEELAERAEVNRNTISLIERGATNPSLDTIFALSEALNVPLKELMDIEV